ncbi:hypothetical protein N7510_004387 [Penicillium lagena]|uniref:uncharacterized protein n=1 Tax=Penicillium lagena TaxID=94218 RepID=UPI00253F82EB|nr:uncharacterized protein N7510_004387 [Penicillium lagena]KAJ5620403.1 hypothetical protein N7510_004387 [Penicillium lagena]
MVQSDSVGGARIVESVWEWTSVPVREVGPPKVGDTAAGGWSIHRWIYTPAGTDQSEAAVAGAYFKATRGSGAAGIILQQSPTAVKE